jgi:hypothetical protein
LPLTGGLEGVGIVDNARFTLVRRPTKCQDIEPSGTFQQAAAFEEVESEASQATLFNRINRDGRPIRVLRFRGANLDKNDTGSMHGHQI